jgi:hypothetical protein
MTDTPNTPEPPPKPNASTPVTTDPPADPAETMYRELEPGEWFLRPEFDQTPRVKTHRGHMCPKWLGAREKEELPVRRLTPAEVAEHFADLAGGSFVAHEEPEFFVGHSGGSPTACLGFTDEDGEEREHVVSVHEARGLAAQLSAWLATLPAQRDTKPTHSSNKAKVYGAMAAQLRAEVELLQSDARGWAGLAGSASAEVEATRHERDSLQGMWRRSQDENTQLRDEVDRLKRVAWGVVNNARNTEHDAAQPRWAYVMRATSLGSGSARSLCVEFGRDPDELLTREDAEE